MEIVYIICAIDFEWSNRNGLESITLYTKNLPYSMAYYIKNRTICTQYVVCIGTRLYISDYLFLDSSSVSATTDNNMGRKGLGSVMTFGFGSFCKLIYRPILANVAAF